MYGVICLSVTLRFLSVPVEKNEPRWQEVHFKWTQIYFFLVIGMQIFFFISVGKMRFVNDAQMT